MPRMTAKNMDKRWTAGLCLLLLLSVSLSAAARYNEQVQGTDPGDIGPSPWTEDVANEVGIIEKINSPVPKGLTLIDEDGSPVELDGFFKERRPVVLNLGYSRCPSICIVMRDQITSVLADTGLELGKDFVILNISIDPNETPAQARDIREQVWARLSEKGLPPATEGWRFLTADQETIQELTEGIGYRYLYIKPQDEYGHPGVLVLADGDGVIRRYMDGKNYDARAMRLTIVETSQGKAGSLLDRAFLTCFVWDPEANNYAATAKFIMMLGGVVVIFFAGGLVLFGLMYEKRRQRLLREGKQGSTAQRPATLWLGGLTRKATGG